jgi:hypothetical protein
VIFCHIPPYVVSTVSQPTVGTGWVQIMTDEIERAEPMTPDDIRKAAYEGVMRAVLVIGGFIGAVCFIFYVFDTGAKYGPVGYMIAFVVVCVYLTFLSWLNNLARRRAIAERRPGLLKALAARSASSRLFKALAAGRSRRLSGCDTGGGHPLCCHACPVAGR